MIGHFFTTETGQSLTVSVKALLQFPIRVSEKKELVGWTREIDWGIIVGTHVGK